MSVSVSDGEAEQKRAVRGVFIADMNAVETEFAGRSQISS